jgi:hypothetical protein
MGIPSWEFLTGQNFEIWLYYFSSLGYPPGVEKNFLFLIQKIYIWSDRARRADHKYHIFIEVCPNIKKNMKTSLVPILIGFW